MAACCTSTIHLSSILTSSLDSTELSFHPSRMTGRRGREILVERVDGEILLVAELGNYFVGPQLNAHRAIRAIVSYVFSVL